MSEEKLNVKADQDNLTTVLDTLEKILEENNISAKANYMLEMALEEIFVNICHYAYAPETGDVEVIFVLEKPEITITLIDSGQPFNPLQKEDPDINAPLEERRIGGLGIFLVKKVLDEFEYKYKNHQNINIIKTNLKD